MATVVRSRNFDYHFESVFFNLKSPFWMALIHASIGDTSMWSKWRPAQNDIKTELIVNQIEMNHKPIQFNDKNTQIVRLRFFSAGKLICVTCQRVRPLWLVNLEVMFTNMSFWLNCSKEDIVSSVPTELMQSKKN